MSGPLAVDVAALLPPALEADVRRLNAALAPPPDGFRFDDTHLPHLTLVQIVIEPTALDRLVTGVADVVRSDGALELTTDGVHRGRTASTLRVEPTDALQALHERLARVCWPLASATVAPEAFFRTHRDDPGPRPADLEWVTRFRSEAAHDRFDPHVTLGIGALDATPPSRRFHLERLALCHLGRFCTCRRVITSWALTGPG